MLLTFFGDDFTGSTDALESLSLSGARTVLFIEPPSQEQLSEYGELDAMGVASISRSLTPALMDEQLKPAFEKLKALGSRHLHYKVCSTFDSSPEIGNIGKVLDIGAEVFQNKIIPILVAAPWLGRYMIFGNLFARFGIGSSGAIYRLDRHPSMSRHPVTPAHESDLRLHLSKQTSKKAGLLDILEIEKSLPYLRSRVNEMISEGFEIVFIDAINEDQLPGIGAFLDDLANEQRPLFTLGSSGIDMALGMHWNDAGILNKERRWETPVPAQPLLVVSGSCSPVTGNQINWALDHGFAELVIDVNQISNNRQAYTKFGLDTLLAGKSLIIHTGGTSTSSQGRVPLSPELLGGILGEMARYLVEQCKLRRVVISGGDTSGYAAKAMGIESMEMIAPLVPGAPLCRVSAPGSPVHGIDINFKGGQVGGEDYFGILEQGTVSINAKHTIMSSPVIVEHSYSAPINKVWKALTDVEDMRKWYFDLAAFTPEIGFEFRFTAGDENQQFEHACRVTQVDVGRKVAYTWAYPGHPGESEVTFELFDEGSDKTRLVITHEGLETFPQDNPAFAKNNFNQGWTEIAGVLAKFLAEKTR